MSEQDSLIRLLRNTPIKELIKALEKDGFSIKRKTRSNSRIYAHLDGRLTVVHSHHGSDMLTRKTLASLLEATKWTLDDLKRLKLIK